MENAAWIQAYAAVVMALVTIALVAVTACYVRLTHKLVKAQVDPVVDLGMSRDGQSLVIHNSGAFQVLEISVNPDIVIFAGPPMSVPLTRLRRGQRILGEEHHDWWHLDRLEPGEIQAHSISDVIKQALRLTMETEKTQRKGQPDSSPSEEKTEFYPFLSFNLVYHRDFDHKRYSMRKIAHVITSVDGRLSSAVDTEDGSFVQRLFPNFYETI